MGYAANNLLPLRLGELVRVYVLRKLANIPGVTGFASLVAERVLDGVIIVTILCASVASLSRTESRAGAPDVSVLVLTAATVFSVAVLLLLVAVLLSPQIRNIAEDKLPETLSQFVAKALDALAFFRRPQDALIVVLLSGMVWLLEGAAFSVVAYQMGVTSPWIAGYLMLAIVNLGILLPTAPAYVGIFQACGIIAFQVLGLPEEQGLALSIVIHACQFVPITILGIYLASHHGWQFRLMAERSTTPSV